MTKYAIVFNNTGKEQPAGYSPWGEIISIHPTLEEAENALMKRNQHLFDKNFAQQMGMQNTGTFDEIVALDDDGHVVEDQMKTFEYFTEEKELFTCEDCCDSFSDDGSCLTIINERRDEIKHYCPYCTEHGRFELNPGDELQYDRNVWREVRQGNNLVYLERA